MTDMTTIGQLVELLAVQMHRGEVTGQPLLQQLRESVYSGTSKNAAGAAEQWRIPLNAAAEHTWTEVKGEIAMLFLSSTDMRPSKVPQVNLLAWWSVFSAAMDRHEVTDLQQTVALERLQRWAASIHALLDPPRTKLLTLACPTCGASKVLLGEGELQVLTDALVVEFRPGIDTIAHCRAEGCGATWVGDVEVIRLGASAGIDLDVDAIRDSKAPVIEVAPQERRMDWPRVGDEKEIDGVVHVITAIAHDDPSLPYVGGYRVTAAPKRDTPT